MSRNVSSGAFCCVSIKAVPGLQTSSLISLAIEFSQVWLARTQLPHRKENDMVDEDYASHKTRAARILNQPPGSRSNLDNL